MNTASKTFSHTALPTGQKAKQPLWWIQLTQYEYWPWYVMYWPVMLYWIFKSIQIGRPFYFTAVNPGMKASGMEWTSKKEILDLIPDAYKPRTLLVQGDEDPVALLTEQGLHYPVIAKPDKGCRGTGVEKIEDTKQLQAYHQQMGGVDYLIQAYIDYHIELGIFYSRLPEAAKGIISSVTLKEFLQVRGNGLYTLEELVASYPRACFQQQRLKKTFSYCWNEVLSEGETLYLEPIGNHCRGTRFINANYLISPELTEHFDHISKQIPGFYYGRFDLRTSSIEDLYAGHKIKIMELNGVISEPAHIYDSRHGLLPAFRDLLWHWKRMAIISVQNRKKGVADWTWKEMRARNNTPKTYNSAITQS